MAAVKMLRLLFILFISHSAQAARLIATSPQTTELVFQMGWGELLVGAMEGSLYPAEAARLPTIGRLFRPSLEKTLSLRPTLVILDTHNINPTFAASLAALNVPSFTWDTLSPESLLSEARRLAVILKTRVPTEVLKWENCLANLATTAASRRKTRYLGFVWMDPPILLGQTSFLSRLLAHLGFENAVSADLKSPYVPVTQEWLLVQKIDKLLYLQHSSEAREKLEKPFSQWWPKGSAPRTPLDAGLFARASLTPLRNLALFPLEFPLPKGCRDDE